MSRGSLVCGDRNNEHEIREVYRESQTNTNDGLTCSDCENTSFGI